LTHVGYTRRYRNDRSLTR